MVTSPLVVDRDEAVIGGAAWSTVEGEPMRLLDSRCLGMPIIMGWFADDFTSNVAINKNIIPIQR